MLAGNFRIGTLHEYRDYEHKEIGDESQGSKYFSLLPSEHPGLTPEKLREMLPWLEKDRPFLSHDGKVLEKIDPRVPLGVEIREPDCYIYCTTSNFDEAVMKRFGYEACVEIKNVKRFFTFLTKGMERYAKFAIIADCVYDNLWGPIESHNEHNAIVLKPKSLKHQREVRFAWQANGPVQIDPRMGLSPKFIYRPDAARCCTQIV